MSDQPGCSADWPPRAAVPASTYRLQFSAQLRFSAALDMVDYFDRLGIDSIYSSPLFRARKESSHGYDVTDHNMIHPDIGTEAEFEQFADELRRRGRGLVMDVVPNHMAIDDDNNVWWQDVLENGRSSPYAKFFDIDWNPPQEELRNKILVPVLGDQYGKVLENGELRLVYEAQRFSIHYYARRFPLAPVTWPRVLGAAIAERLGDLAAEDPARMELESIVTALAHLPSPAESDVEKIRQGRREQEVARRRLAALVQESTAVRQAVDSTIRDFNGRLGEPRSFDRLESLLAEQTYRLSYWRVAADEINYRRFFDINELAALRVEDPEVFAAAHVMLFRFLERGWVTGLRIDHVDGLLDPQQYLVDLQDGFGRICDEQQRANHDSKRPLYIVVEKILGPRERLRTDWPMHGTTGYDFLNLAGGIFVERHAARPIKEIYARFTDVLPRFAEIYYLSKRTILGVAMSSELHMLSRRLNTISEQHRWSRDFTQSSLRRALAEIVACFPVYRSYVRPVTQLVCDEDRQIIQTAVRAAQRRNPGLSKSLFDFVAAVLLLEDPDGLSDDDRQVRRDFVLRFQQFTGPVTAKGLEDTAFYRVYPLASLNEVGGEPSDFGTSLEEFHRRMVEQAATWPATMLGSSTHDTKRGEDVRARINVLSEIPDDWQSAIVHWHGLNRGAKSQIEGTEAPDMNEEYLFYQTLVGSWPLEEMNAEAIEVYTQRIVAYMHKATKEAKLNTSWINPDEEYAAAIERFVRGALDRENNLAFLQSLASMVGRIVGPGMCNALAQLMLKIGAPGVADFYQGTELWDLNLVDPDNRQPVDFERRKTALGEIEKRASQDRRRLVAELVDRWPDSRIKLYLSQAGLRFRRDHAPLFLAGEYLPLAPVGPQADHVFAFARRQGQAWAIVVVPRCVAGLIKPGRLMASPEVWKQTLVTLFPAAPQRWQNVLTGEPVQTVSGDQGPQLPLDVLFGSLPVALLAAGV